MDISVTVPSLPGPGMTVLGSAARYSPGGKGGNQAVAAARLGAEVRMVGCVGDDAFGRQLLADLRVEHVGTDQVRVIQGTPTGLAMIAVDSSAENLIVVAPGANREVSSTDVAAAQSTPTDVIVISAEIPVPAITAALARQPGVLCILNLAPVPPNAAAIIADRLDWLVVNESEAAALLNPALSDPSPSPPAPIDPPASAPPALQAAAQAAAALVALGARHAVVTAGAQGAALVGPDGTNTIPGFKVQAVDTVGAGDTFVGALAVALAAGVPPREAVRAAAAAGAAAVTRPGAQTAMPRPPDILSTTGLKWPEP
jgi:ribokinase